MKAGAEARGGGPIRWAALALVAALVGAYLPVWHADFIWDDDLHLTANPHVLSAGGLAAIWSSGAANYFPLTMTSFWALHAGWGLNPLAYHLATLGLHLGCAVLLGRVLTQLGVRGAWLGAALWALHPVQAESVAWISELKNTQSCLFYLLAVGFFLRWLDAEGPTGLRRAPGWDALAWTAALAAILSKSSTVMLPVVLGLCWWWRRRAWHWRDVRWLVPFLALSLVASAWTIWEQKYNSKAMGAEWNQSLPERIVIAGRVLWFYLGKLVWPEPLIFIYPRWVIDATQVSAWVPAGGALATLAALWHWRDGAARPWFLAAAYFAVSLFPVLGFFDVYFFRFSFVGDHLQYLASIGVAAGVGAACATVADRVAAAPRVRAGLAGAGLAGLAGLTYLQAGTYRDGETLYRTILARNPACWLAHNNLGQVLLASGRRAEGLAAYRAALRYKSDYFEPRFNLGTAALEEGRPAEALDHLTHAMAAQPADAATHNSLGVALLQLQRAAEATPHFEQAVRLDPKLAPAHYNLANARFLAGRMDEARRHYETSLQLAPEQPMARNNLGLVEQRSGRPREAAAHFEAALRGRADYGEARFNLANVKLELGETAAAVELYATLLQARPDFADGHNNLGNALLRLGRPADALTHYEAALRLQPNYLEAQNNRASALHALGRGDEAIAALEAVVQRNPNYTDARNNLARLRAMRQTDRPRN